MKNISKSITVLDIRNFFGEHLSFTVFFKRHGVDSAFRSYSKLSINYIYPLINISFHLQVNVHLRTTIGMMDQTECADGHKVIAMILIGELVLLTHLLFLLVQELIILLTLLLVCNSLFPVRSFVRSFIHSLFERLFQRTSDVQNVHSTLKRRQKILYVVVFSRSLSVHRNLVSTSIWSKSTNCIKTNSSNTRTMFHFLVPHVWSNHW